LLPERDIRADITPWEGYPSVGHGGGYWSPSVISARISRHGKDIRVLGLAADIGPRA